MRFFNRSFWEKLYSKIPDFIKNDPARKLLALALALLIFAYYHNNKVQHLVKVENVPVKVTVPEGYYILNTPAPVTVSLKCSSLAAKAVPERSVNIQIPVRIQEGQEKYEIRLKDHISIDAFFGISVADVFPQTITVAVDKRVSRNVKVEVDLKQMRNLPETYTILKAVSQPEEVLVTGPSSLLKGLEKINTKEIPLDSTVTRSFIYSAPLALPENTFLAVSPEQVIVSVSVDRSHIRRTFRGIPVKLLMPSSVNTTTGVEIISSRKVDITVSGIKSVMESISEKDIVPYADVSRISRDGLYNNIPVKCWSQKEGITIQSVIPDSINVRIGSHVSK